jgi:hypothetical protein
MYFDSVHEFLPSTRYYLHLHYSIVILGLLSNNIMVSAAKNVECLIKSKFKFDVLICDNVCA